MKRRTREKISKTVGIGGALIALAPIINSELSGLGRAFDKAVINPVVVGGQEIVRYYKRRKRLKFKEDLLNDKI